MELYLDTADVNAVKRLARILPLHGVTTNPSIVAKEENRFGKCYRRCAMRWGHRQTLCSGDG